MHLLNKEANNIKKKKSKPKKEEVEEEKKTYHLPLEIEFFYLFYTSIYIYI